MLLSHSQFRILIFIIGFTAIVADIINTFAFFILKPFCSATIMVYSLSCRNPTLKKYPLQISIGLFFCFLGDIFLLLETFFIYGLVSFLISHLIFLFAFIKRQGWQWRPTIILVLLPIAATIFIFISKDLGDLYIPVMIYLIVILLMSWQGWAMTLNPKLKQHRFLGLAVSLFLFSDALIAINKFSYNFSFSGALILSSYWLSIYLIADSATR